MKGRRIVINSSERFVLSSLSGLLSLFGICEKNDLMVFGGYFSGCYHVVAGLPNWLSCHELLPNYLVVVVVLGKSFLPLLCQQ